MKTAKRNVAAEIIADLKQMHATLAAGTSLAQRYTVRSHGRVAEPSGYDAAAVRRIRDLLGVSQPVFAQLLGVSPALVRSWEGGQRVPAPIARPRLDAIAARPADWRAMVPAARGAGGSAPNFSDALSRLPSLVDGSEDSMVWPRPDG